MRTGDTLSRFTYLDIAPQPTNAEQLADLTARLNWYLPPSFRKLPVYAGTRAPTIKPTASAAPHMDPELLGPTEWLTERPEGRGYLIVTETTTESAMEWLKKRGSATTVDPALGTSCDERWFDLGRQACSEVAAPGPAESLRRLGSIDAQNTSGIVIATGPTAQLVDPDAARVTYGVRITCNSAVRDHDLLARLRPQVIAFGDPHFHYGPSRYCSQFRADLRRVLADSDALILTTDLYYRPLLAHMPEIADRIAVIPLVDGGEWRWPTPDNPTIRLTGNVLTNLMLPAAFALCDTVAIAGCDGRNPSENYFWKHNKSTQYADELMNSVFEAHPGFFKYRVYADYYEKHCRQLEAFLGVAERRGKTVSGLTPSHIAALKSRGAPTFDD